MIMYMPQTRLHAQPTRRNVIVQNCMVPTMKFTQQTDMEVLSRDAIRLLPPQNADKPDKMVPAHCTLKSRLGYVLESMDLASVCLQAR